MSEALRWRAAETGSPARRIGAYIMPGDPIWLASSLSQYYPLLDELVIIAPRSHRGWTGIEIPVDECLDIVRRLDTRGIQRIVWGEWANTKEPMRADSAQRQAAIDALGDGIDWILQIDNDEVLPNPAALISLLSEAERRGIGAVEWPMRVLFRRLRGGDYLEVCGPNGSPRYDYPGPIAVRPGRVTSDARRGPGAFLRPVVRGDKQSLQLRQSPTEGEVRLEALSHSDAIVHNSWGREPSAVHRKIRTWGHAAGLKGEIYYWSKWWLAPALWPVMRNFHPFARGLWPRLTRTRDVARHLIEPDR